MTRGDTDADGAGPRLRRDQPGLLTVAVGPVGRFDDRAVRTLSGLARIGRELTGDIRVVVLELAESNASTTDSASGEDRDPVLAGYQEGVAWLRRADVVSVATARGPLTGVAVELALCCDLRLLGVEASLTLTGARTGGAPLLGATGRLVDLVGAARATELCLTGRTVGAAEAERIGLVSRVVPGTELEVATDALVAGLLAADRVALTETKALLNHTLRDQLAAERESFARRARPDAG
ncbi:enoyl-CoA hydratase/isomerase family protein [Cryptosporangium aurantiacum]|nr:enoyl-CoA hydratase-related protein [Cryptosporangium aurantiacum]